MGRRYPQADALDGTSRPGVACGLADLRRFGEPGMQPIADLLWGVRATVPLRPDNNHPGGGDADKTCQSKYFPPAHVPRLRP